MQEPTAREDGAARRLGFTLRELEVLQALVETGKTTVAAQRLGLSQPSVSRCLTQLEARLRRRLFERKSGRLRPTVDALAISEELVPIFAALARIGNRSDPRERSHTGTLRIAAPPTIGHRFMPSRVARFTKDNPDLEIIFDVVASDCLVTSVAESRYDLGLTDTVPGHEGIRTELLLATEAICVLPNRHRLADRTAIRPEDLEGEPFVALTRRHSSRTAVDRIFERAGVRRKLVIETATTVSAVEFVREGLGLALMNPFPIVHQLGRGVVFRPFVPEIAYSASFLLPHDRPPTAAAKAFMEMTRASLDHSAYPTTSAAQR